jgi:hypothetical protein
VALEDPISVHFPTSALWPPSKNSQCPYNVFWTPMKRGLHIPGGTPAFLPLSEGSLSLWLSLPPVASLSWGQGPE